MSWSAQTFNAAISCGCILAAKVKILIGGLRPDGGQIAHHVLTGGPLWGSHRMGFFLPNEIKHSYNKSGNRNYEVA
jgi:hypothetical protein